MCPYTYEEYIEYFSDWSWDTVIVRPLVRIENKIEELPELIGVNRIYIFPLGDR